MIIFSPHPDDDVISMGGTFDRLVEQGHEVHVAYQTSGNIAVSDYEALKYAEVVKDINSGSVNIDGIINKLKSKKLYLNLYNFKTFNFLTNNYQHQY